MKNSALIIFSLLVFINNVNAQSNKFDNPPVVQNENYSIEIINIKAEKKTCAFKVIIKNNLSTDFIQLNPFMVGGFVSKETIYYPSSKKTLRTLKRTNKWIIEPNTSSSKIITLPTGKFLEAEDFSILIKQFSIGDWNNEANRVVISPLQVSSSDKKAENEKRRIKAQNKLAKVNRRKEKKERSKAKELEKLKVTTIVPTNTEESVTSLTENVSNVVNNEEANTNGVNFKITYKEKGICGWNITIIQNGVPVCLGLTNSLGEFTGEFAGEVNTPIIIKGKRGRKQFVIAEFYSVKHLSETNFFEINKYMNALKNNSLKEVAQSSNQYANDKEGIDQMNNVMNAQEDMIESVKEDRKNNPSMMGESHDKQVQKELETGGKIFKGAHTVARVGMYSKYLTNNKAKKELIKLKLLRLTKCL